MSLSKTLLLVGVGAVSAAVGVAVPIVMGGSSKVARADVDPASAKPADDHSSATLVEKSAEHGHAEAKSNQSEHSAGHSDGHGESAAPTGPQFIPLDRIVVNLNEPALTKYLSLSIALQSDGRDKTAVKDAVKEREPILRSWLTSHLADKSIEDVRGKVGVNRLRREIQDQFNTLLFDDGRERVRDVLFEEFHVE